MKIYIKEENKVGNLFDDTSQPTQQMQLGSTYWQKQVRKPIFTKELAKFNKRKAEESRQRRDEFKKWAATKGKRLVEKSQKDYLTTSNDNTWVENRNPLIKTSRLKNPHLTERSVKGAKAHAAWVKAHPNLDTWGTMLGAVPFAIASAPLAAAAGSGIAALGDAAAVTSAGQAITAGLTPLTTAASTSVAGAPLYTWADAGLSSLFGAHGIQTAMDEGGVSPTTALELLPLAKVVKPTIEMGYNATKPVVNKVTTELQNRYPALFDPYTSWDATLGNHGNNIFSRAIGTVGRKYGYTPKAEVPEFHRRLSIDEPGDMGITDDGKLIISSGRKGDGHDGIVNFATSEPARSHRRHRMLSSVDDYIIDPKAIGTQNFKSIQPSDTFFETGELAIDPKNITLISGNIDVLNQARSMGIKTLSSPRLRKLKTNTTPINKGGTGLLAKFDFSNSGNDGQIGTEIQRLASMRGTPTMKDYAYFEGMTGLNSGVIPKTRYNLENASTIIGRWGGVRRIPTFNNVIYDPATSIEAVYRKAKIGKRPWADYYERLEKMPSARQQLGLNSAMDTYLGEPQVPENFLTIKPQVRTKVGDVEIDNPNLLYHLDRGDGAGAFSSQGAYIQDGMLFPGTPKESSAIPYSWWNKGKPYATSVNGQPMTRLVTATKDSPGMIHVKSQNYPIGQWNGKRGFVLPSEYVNPKGVNVAESTYMLEPNYGWKRVLSKDIPTAKWHINSKTTSQTKEYVDSPKDITSDVGELIAEGSERSVYSSKSNPNIVYKIEDGNAALENINNIKIRSEITDDVIAPETTIGYYKHKNGKYYRVTQQDKYKSFDPDNYDVDLSSELNKKIINTLKKAGWKVETVNGVAKTASKNGKVLRNLEYYNWGIDSKGNLKLVDQDVIENSKPLLITPENAASITPEQWTAAQDAAVARGDMAEAQRLRELHFKVRAPTPHISKGVYLPSGSKPTLSQADYYNGNNDFVTLYHSSVDADKLIKEGFDGVEHGLGRTKGEAKGTIFASANTDYAADYSNLYIQEGLSTPDKVGLVELKVPRGAGVFEGNEVRLRPEHIKEITKSAYEKTPWLSWLKTRKTNNNLFNIKSADAVTYDDKGVRIPLGERDNFTNPDKKYKRGDVFIEGEWGPDLYSYPEYIKYRISKLKQIVPDKIKDYTVPKLDPGEVNLKKEQLISRDNFIRNTMGFNPMAIMSMGKNLKTHLWEINRRLSKLYPDLPKYATEGINNAENTPFIIGYFNEPNILGWHSSIRGINLVEPTPKSNLPRTMLHEGVMHGTDSYMTNEIANAYLLFINKIYESPYMKNGIFTKNNWHYKAPEGTERWEEGRATFGEIRKLLYDKISKDNNILFSPENMDKLRPIFEKTVDKLNTNDVADLFNKISGYGEVYGTVGPKANSNFLKDSKDLLKYMPVTLPFLIPKKKEKK